MNQTRLALERREGAAREASLGQACAGDQCLQNDGARRYETADTPADNVERHSRDEPVVDLPPSAVDRLQRIFGWHPWHSEPPVLWAWLSWRRYR